MHLAKEIDANIMDSQLVKSLGTTITASSFRRMVNEIIHPFGAKAVIKRVKQKTPNTMWVSGCFFEGTDKIHIYYHLDPKRQTVELNARTLNRIIFLTSQTLQHELIHQAQEKRLGAKFYVRHIPVLYSKRIQKKRKDNIEYFSMKEEIDCYGQNIAMELVYNHPKESRASLFKNIEKRKSWGYSEYKKTFKNTEWEPVKRALLKKIWKWLPKVSAPPRL